MAFLQNKDLVQLFQVTPVTLYNWRTGTGKKEALPYYTQDAGSSHRILYKATEVRTWAKRNNVKIH